MADGLRLYYLDKRVPNCNSPSFVGHRAICNAKIPVIAHISKPQPLVLHSTLPRGTACYRSGAQRAQIPSIPKCFSAVAAPQRSSTSTCGSASGGSASVSRRVAPRPGISKRLVSTQSLGDLFCQASRTIHQDMMRGVAFDLDRYQHSSFHQSSRPYPVFRMFACSGVH